MLDLQARLDAFPEDLEDILDKLFNSLKHLHKVRAAWLFLLVTAWRSTGVPPDSKTVELEKPSKGLRLSPDPLVISQLTTL